jgi:hypothetical protein
MIEMLASLLLLIGEGQTPPVAAPRDRVSTQAVSAAISGLISEQGSAR